MDIIVVGPRMLLTTHETMDIIMVWMLFPQNVHDHGRYPGGARYRPWTLSWLGPHSTIEHGCHHGWAMDAMRSPPHAVEHGRYHGWPMDALSLRTQSNMDIIMVEVGSWMLSLNMRSSMVGPFILSSQTHSIMDVIIVGPWMLRAQNAFDHGRCHGWAMAAIFSGCIIMDINMVGPWMLCAQDPLEIVQPH
eukprot:s3263_g5.t1